MVETLGACWERTLAQQPAAIAVIDPARELRWTRADLAAAVAAQRDRLPATDLGGRTLVLAGRNSPEWLAVFLATVQAGGIPLALDADEPPERQRSLAQQVGAAALWNGETWIALPSPRRRTRQNPRIALRKLTSGSTGEPRVLSFSDAQMLADGRQVCATMRIGPEDVNYAVIPFGHSYGLGNLVIPLLMQGTAIVVGSATLPQVMAAEIAQARPTVWPAVPALLRWMVRADIAPETLQSLRLVISAGAPLEPEVAGAFQQKFCRTVHGFYGSSETGGITFDRTGEATASGRSVGTPLEGVGLDFGRGGRFVVSSPAVMGRGCYSPPDRGTLNAAGEVVLRGRVGRMVKVAGRRLDLGEVERIVRAVPGVRGAWAAADPRQAGAVAAVVATYATPAELRAQLVARAAAWKIPDRLVVVPDLPLTARGKVDTRRLRALL